MRPVMRLGEVPAVLAGIVGAVDIGSLVAVDALDIAMGSGLRRLGHKEAPFEPSTGALPGRLQKNRRTKFFLDPMEPACRCLVEQFG